MRKLNFLGGIAACILLLQFTGLSMAQTVPGEDTGVQRLRSQQRAAEAQPVGPSAVGDISGTFRVKGKVRKKTSGYTSCTCYVYFDHANAVGGDFYTYMRKNVSGKNCNMNVPFHFFKGDTGRPVIVSMNAYCSGDNNLYRSYSEDLPDIPLKSGKSAVIKFDVDM